MQLLTARLTKNKKYIIVDDVVTLGSNLIELKKYIERAGGEVVGISALAGRTGVNITLKKDTLKSLYDKFEKKELNDVIKEIGLANGAEELTEQEAKFFIQIQRS